MEKFLKVYKFISIIAGIILIISIGLSFMYGLKGDVFLKINSKNRDSIIEMCQANSISLKGKLTQIGYKQGLGDWYLYLTYEDGSLEQEILDDPVGTDLRSYIRENGQVGGSKGAIVDFLIKVAGIIVSIYVVCYVIYRIRS